MNEATPSSELGQEFDPTWPWAATVSTL